MQKKMIRIAQIAAFILVLVIAVHSAYSALRWKETSDDYICVTDQLYATKDNLVDAVFLGSSHCYCGIYPAVMWEEMGLATFDMSISGQDKNSTYYSLVELLKTQKPKVVMIDVFGLVFEKHEVESNQYRNYLSLKTSANSVNAVKGFIPKEKWQDYIARFPIIHTRYKELKKYDFVTNTPNTFGRGGRFFWWPGAVNYDPESINDEEFGELSESNRKWLDDCMALAKEYDFELEFIFIPNNIRPDQQEILNAAQLYVEERGFKYTDFNRMVYEIGIDVNHDFIDPAHLNAYGAEKLSRYLGNKLVNEYGLESHAGDSKYYQWDLDAKWYHEEACRYLMEHGSSIDDFTSATIQTEDVYVLISLEGDLSLMEEYYPAIEVLGISHEDYLEGGKWLYYNGKVEKIHDNVEGQPDYIMKFNKYDTLKVGYYGPCESGNIMVNRVTYQQGAWINFLAYSELQQSVIAARGF